MVGRRPRVNEGVVLRKGFLLTSAPLTSPTQVLVKPSPTLDLRDWMVKTSILPSFTPAPSPADATRTASALCAVVNLASRGASIYVLAPSFAEATVYEPALGAATARGVSIAFVALAIGAGAEAAATVATLAAFDAGLEPWDGAVVSVVPPDPHALASWGGVVARDVVGCDARTVTLTLGGRAGVPSFIVPLLAQTEVLSLDGLLARHPLCPCHGAPIAAVGGNWAGALCASTRAPLALAACTQGTRHLDVGGLPLKISAKAARVRDPPGGDAVLPPCELGAPCVARVTLTAVGTLPLAAANDGLLFGTPFYLVADDGGDDPLAALTASLRARATALVVASTQDVATGTARSLVAHYLLRPTDADGVAVLLGRRLAAGDERLPLTVECGACPPPAAVVAAADAAVDALPMAGAMASGAAELLAGLAAVCVAPDAGFAVPAAGGRSRWRPRRRGWGVVAPAWRCTTRDDKKWHSTFFFMVLLGC